MLKITRAYHTADNAAPARSRAWSRTDCAPVGIQVARCHCIVVPVPLAGCDFGTVPSALAGRHFPAVSMEISRSHLSTVTPEIARGPLAAVAITVDGRRFTAFLGLVFLESVRVAPSDAVASGNRVGWLVAVAFRRGRADADLEATAYTPATINDRPAATASGRWQSAYLGGENLADREVSRTRGLSAAVSAQFLRALRAAARLCARAAALSLSARRPVGRDPNIQAE
jgi:hypothetical protein